MVFVVFSMATQQHVLFMTRSASLTGQGKTLASGAEGSADDLFLSRQKLVANNGAAEDNFGNSVAISGDTAVIGSPYEDLGAANDQGAAYVYIRDGSGWQFQAKLTAADGAAGDALGTSVAISAETIIVGAQGDNISVNADQGSAYVFTRSGTSWSQQAKIVANDGEENDNFGQSAAITGDYAIIGARFDGNGANLQQGSAYIYLRNGTTWTRQDKLIASDGASDDFFGGAVAIVGTSVIIGAAGDDIGANTNQGSAYVFTRSGTTWTQQAKLTADDGEQNEYFGTSVDIVSTLSNPIAVVGAWRDRIGQNFGQGSAYVFTRTQNVWSLSQKLTAIDGANNDGFGVSVSILSVTGNIILVGARFAGNRGSGYIFRRVNSAWTEQQKLVAGDAGTGDNFGSCVVISGETAIIGAFGDDVGSNPDQGSAYIFEVGNAVPFDFDGDNKSDISIFRPSNGQWWINRSSNATTFATTFGQTTDKIMPADFTGDGRSDIAFFRPSTGSWFVLRSEDFSFFSFPFGVSTDTPTVGDFDGDGKADAAVFRPSNSTWYISKSSGGTTIQQFGAAGDVPAVADYDGDGRSDIAIFRANGGSGAEWWRQNSSNNLVAAFQFGASTDKAVPGDFTGDGKADIAFWRPANGSWYVLRSEDLSFFAFPFGGTNDIPVPGDYDGDGKFDAAVFRPSNVTWYVQRSSAGTLIQQFGSSGDQPLPSAFIP